MPVNCPNCKASNRDSAKFCAICGTTLPTLPVPSEPEGGVPVLPIGAANLTGRLPANFLIHNRYLIINKVGQGGMAAVYQVSDTQQPGQIWAVKEMSDAFLMAPQERSLAVQAFVQEANLLRTLNHRNLPRVTEVFDEGGKHYLVMEFVPGQTLEALLTARPNPFSEPEVINWGLQLSDVLVYLHSRNIVFRDLKPSNIILTPSGQIKLIDFGIVRFFKPGQSQDTIALGTPGYAAPEATSGQTDARSDVYSLCVTLHELLTKHNPSTTPFRVPPARRINPAVSAAMDQILSRGLAAQRDQRWPNVSELRAALAQLSLPGGRPPQGAMPPAPTAPAKPLSKTARPTTRLLMAATQLPPRRLGLIAAGLVLAVVAAAWLLTPALSRLPIDWNNFPVMGLFGALGYSALRRWGAAFAVHTVPTVALVGTIYVRMTGTHYSYPALLLAAVVSGAFMEIWAALTNRVKGRTGDAGWRRELAWMAGMAAIGMPVFYLLLSAGRTGANPVIWIVAAIFGALGWFLGDLAHQYLVYRKAGFRWS